MSNYFTFIGCQYVLSMYSLLSAIHSTYNINSTTHYKSNSDLLNYLPKYSLIQFFQILKCKVHWETQLKLAWLNPVAMVH